jgi:hypothetical protein
VKAATDAARNLLHIGADLFGEIGNLVDEGDLGGEKALAAYLINSAVRRAVNISGPD